MGASQPTSDRFSRTPRFFALRVLRSCSRKLINTHPPESKSRRKLTSLLRRKTGFPYTQPHLEKLRRTGLRELANFAELSPVSADSLRQNFLSEEQILSNPEHRMSSTELVDTSLLHDITCDRVPIPLAYVE